MDSNENDIENYPSLEPNATDGLIAAIRAATGLINFHGLSVGNLLAELIIPHFKNQWSERISQFVIMLSEKVSSIPLDKINSLLKDPSCAHILEEGALSSLKIYSEKRREQLANLIANSLSNDYVNEDATISLIRILSELNDSEVILLISKSPLTNSNFREQHRSIIDAIHNMRRPGEEEYLVQIMHPHYIAHLVQLDLINPVYNDTKPARELVKDPYLRPPKITGYTTTKLGMQLLELIDAKVNPMGPLESVYEK